MALAEGFQNVRFRTLEWTRRSPSRHRVDALPAYPIRLKNSGLQTPRGIRIMRAQAVEQRWRATSRAKEVRGRFNNACAIGRLARRTL